MKTDDFIPVEGSKTLLIIVAWVSIVLISDLPDIVINIFAGAVPGWILLCKACFLAILLAICYFLKLIRALLPYAVVMLVFFAGLTLSEWVSESRWWAELLNQTSNSFFITWIRPFIRDTGVALAVISALWILKRRRSDFFLVKGHLNASIEPVSWLGIRQGESWHKFGWIFAVMAALIVAIPTFISLHASAAVLQKAFSLIPAAILFAAINAFNEEIYFRTTLLSTLPAIIGRNHAMLLNIFLFGSAHYLYGSPPGITGFLMTGFLAFILGKSMLETKGFLWPWFIHFLPDVMIFYSYAVGWVLQ